MNPQSASGTPSDKDWFALLMLTPLFVPTALTFLAARVESVKAWMLDHHVLATADEAVVAVPGLGGAGLDAEGATTAIVVLLLLVALVLIAGGGRDARRQRTQG